MLLGRDLICAQLDELVENARHGRGSALALTGEPGVGKTTLLEHIAESAPDMTVLRASGAPSETSMSYAGLSALLAPLLDTVPDLPEPQVQALSAALAIGPPVVGADRFPVCAGAMGLILAAAAAAPLLVVVDDAHWLDESSLDVLTFVQRRLQADPVLIVLAFRTGPGVSPPPSTFPTLQVDGLDESAATELLHRQDFHLDDEALAWLVGQTRGNPLALLDLPRLLEPSELRSRVQQSEPVPVGSMLATTYGRSIGALPAQCQRALLLLALMDGQDSSTIQRAFGAEGIRAEHLSPAEDQGLVEVEQGDYRFRHPLIRSAVHQNTKPSDLRSAHLVAATALAPSQRPNDQAARAWHLAAASRGVDDSVAKLLEDVADADLGRSGYHAASLAYERAAHLTSATEDRRRRLVAAAEAALTAGQSARANALLRQAVESSGGVGETPTEVVHLLGRLKTWTGDPLRAADMLEQEAVRIRVTDPATAAQLLVDATVAAGFAGHTEVGLRTATLLKEVSASLSPEVQILGDIAIGSVRALRGDGDAVLSYIGRPTQIFDRPDPPVRDLEAVLYLAAAYTFIDHLERAAAMFRRVVESARHYGAVGRLPFALAQAARVDFRRGAWEAAYAGAAEAVRLAEDTGQATDYPNTLAVLALVEAGRGEAAAEGRCLRAIEVAARGGSGIIQAQALSVLGLLHLGHGQAEQAIDPLRQCGQICEELGLWQIGHVQWGPELVEALTLTDELQEARALADRIYGYAERGGVPIALALAHRSKGIVADDHQMEQHFLEAIRWHERADVRPFELARTRLWLGQRLRRMKRRRDARTHLSQAWDVFARLGAQPWAERAAHELATTGVSVEGAIPGPTDLLTPQELQVALLVGRGQSNRDVATSLFLSRKTVEFHLSSVYRKLGVRSRDQLPGLLRDRPVIDLTRGQAARSQV